jgi:hypothetical protein
MDVDYCQAQGAATKKAAQTVYAGIDYIGFIFTASFTNVF